MLARTSCLDRWPGELNEVDLLIQKNSKPKLIYYYRSIALASSIHVRGAAFVGMSATYLW